MKILPLAVLLSSPFTAIAEPCPAVPDRTAQLDEVLSRIRAAPDETTSKLLTDGLWAILTKAPDERAQRLLYHGVQRRAAYDFETSLAALDALTADCPDYAEGYNQRAFVHFIRGDFATALVDLERAIDFAPNHVAALAGQALTLMSLGRAVQGQAVLREALKLHPWLPERHMLTKQPGEDI